MDEGSEELKRISGVEQLLAELIAIDSTNPDLGVGSGEAAIADHCLSWLAGNGVEAWLQETIRPGRPNVIGRVTGGGGPTLMLNAHLDTVGAGGMVDPFTPRVEHGRMHGRGAIDTKSGLAALMVATAEAARRPLSGTVIFTGVADEEYRSVGTEAVVAAYRADAAIVSEPTNLDVVIAHQGFVWFEIETSGRAAHGSRPDLGVDAIAMMGSALSALRSTSDALLHRPGHPLLGSGSMHASLVQGGQELSSYPSQCVLAIERRTLPGETGHDVAAELEAMLDAIATGDPAFNAELRPLFERHAYEIDADHPFADLVVRRASSVLGRPAAVSGHAAWMDSAILGAAGIPTVVFGPIGEGLHADDEWVDLGSVRTMVEVVCGVIEDFAG